MIQHDRISIVVVDDDAFQRFFAVKLLETLGYRAHEAADGPQALDLLRETGAPILLCDLEMPGMDGHELVRRVRAQDSGEDGAYVHVIMLTASEQSRDRDVALEAGVDDFMVKPLDQATLSARIGSVRRLIEHEALLKQRTQRLAEANARILEDLNAASDAQRRLLPDAGGRFGGLAFHAAFVPSQILSGDMFGFFELQDGYVGMHTIDVSGHGVRASLKSVALGHLLTAAYYTGNGFDEDGIPDPARLVARLNARFYHEGHEEYFTMFCGVLNTRDGVLHFCNAGYQPPWLGRADGRVEALDAAGFPVGLLPDMGYETQAVHLMEGDFVFLCSDGATEAENGDGRALGESGVKAVLDRHAREPASIPARLQATLDGWREGRALDDDLTILICERTRT